MKDAKWFCGYNTSARWYSVRLHSANGEIGVAVYVRNKGKWTLSEKSTGRVVTYGNNPESLRASLLKAGVKQMIWESPASYGTRS